MGKGLKISLYFSTKFVEGGHFLNCWDEIILFKYSLLVFTPTKVISSRECSILSRTISLSDPKHINFASIGSKFIVTSFPSRKPQSSLTFLRVGYPIWAIFP